MVFSTIKRRPKQFGLSAPKHLDDDINTTSTFCLRSGANSLLQQPKVPLLRMNSEGRHEALPMSWQFCSICVNITRDDDCYYWMINIRFKGNHTNQCLGLTSVILSVSWGSDVFVNSVTVYLDNNPPLPFRVFLLILLLLWENKTIQQNLFWCC